VLAIREQIASAVDVVVHQARFADGSRRITSIMEVTGMESGRVQMQPLFEFRAALGQRGTAVRGSFEPCNTVPAFYEGLRASGVSLDLSLFMQDAPADADFSAAHTQRVRPQSIRTQPTKGAAYEA
jgi:pilus assembly protein CpaF